MTIREFVNAVSKKPNLLDLEIGFVTKTKKESGGQFDGGVWVHLNPVQSVTIGGEGLLFWIKPKAEKKQFFRANLAKWPGMTVLGPIPDSLKW